ncbi:hypothetical protein CKAN_02760100 [Cinnamomum micranthum f. kanehirae]|uniref:Uncharacterized protein n=1 Tax=Cinnamomum micranthum f. kanehirae TaxID=337451 RepID=A0A443Q521_9MAGN|nr:hypothetical protein CKAN_02760100 [Cinnamomum micranthum f. kanehirae]
MEIESMRLPEKESTQGALLLQSVRFAYRTHQKHNLHTFQIEIAPNPIPATHPTRPTQRSTPAAPDAESCSEGSLQGHERRRVVGNQHDGGDCGHEEWQRDGGKHRGGEAAVRSSKLRRPSSSALGEEARASRGGEGEPIPRPWR